MSVFVRLAHNNVLSVSVQIYVPLVLQDIYRLKVGRLLAILLMGSSIVQLVHLPVLPALETQLIVPLVSVVLLSCLQLVSVVLTFRFR